MISVALPGATFGADYHQLMRMMSMPEPKHLLECSSPKLCPKLKLRLRFRPKPRLQLSRFMSTCSNTDKLLGTPLLQAQRSDEFKLLLHALSTLSAADAQQEIQSGDVDLFG